MVFVRDWDFNWHQVYYYRRPLSFPRGTRLEVSALYDNSEASPRQFNHPPKAVRWGLDTTDEMCVCLFLFQRPRPTRLAAAALH